MVRTLDRPQSLPLPRVRKVLPLVVAALALAFAGGANATPVYGTGAVHELTGSRSVGDGLVGYGAWTTKFQVAWDIAFTTAGTWHYAYTFSGLDGSEKVRPIRQFVLDLSDDCVGADCVSNVAPSGPFSFGDFEGITGAVKFSFGGEEGFTYSFDSDRSPIYGHLAVQGNDGPYGCGSKNPFPNVVCNVGLRIAEGAPGEMDVRNYIPRPDGIPRVPEISTGLALALGIVVAARGRRRSQDDRA